MAVLTHAGMFDTSHMAAVMVEGPDALDLLQWCFTNDLSACIGKDRKALFPGRCVYGAYLDEKGHVIDDTIIYMLEENRYMAVVNAGMGSPAAAHFAAQKGGRNVTVTDLTDNLGKMDIQGPLSAKVMKTVLANPDAVFGAMPYFSFKGDFNPDSPLAGQVRLSDGTPVLLSRTGYTGEFGFEIFVEPAHFVRGWEMLLKAGEPFGVIPCGLAARDSLRAGAVLPLSHQDIGHWPFIHNPWPFALPWDKTGKSFTKSFLGADALKDIENPEYTLAFAGNDLRKVSTPAVVADEDGHEIGTVLTCATDMAIGRHEGKIYSAVSPDAPEGFAPKGLCCGFVKVNRSLPPGAIIELRDGRRKLKVQIESDIRPARTARKPLKEML